MRIHNWPRAMFEYQAPATLNQAAPVQDTWYDVLPVTKNCRVYEANVNVEDANEDLEFQIIVDGETIPSYALTATHSTNYIAGRESSAISRLDLIRLTSTTVSQYRGFLVEGHSVQIQVRKITSNGAGNLTGIVTFGVLKNV
jgi:hypothetical protein